MFKVNTLFPRKREIRKIDVKFRKGPKSGKFTKFSTRKFRIFREKINSFKALSSAKSAFHMQILIVLTAFFSQNFHFHLNYHLTFRRERKTNKTKDWQTNSKSNVFRYPETVTAQCAAHPSSARDEKLSGKLSQPNAENPFLLSSSPFEISRKISFDRFSLEG